LGTPQGKRDGLKYLFRAAKAYVKDETPATDERQNAKVSL